MAKRTIQFDDEDPKSVAIAAVNLWDYLRKHNLQDFRVTDLENIIKMHDFVGKKIEELEEGKDFESILHFFGLKNTTENRVALESTLNNMGWRVNDWKAPPRYQSWERKK